jgi:hypothetical protein
VPLTPPPAYRQAPYGQQPQAGAPSPQYPAAHRPQHPPAAYQQPYALGYVPAVRPTSGHAVASFVLGIVALAPTLLSIIPIVGAFVSIVTVPLAVVGIVLGHMALPRIRREGLAGKGLAIAGLILGYLRLLLFVGGVILGVIAVGMIGSFFAYLTS